MENENLYGQLLNAILENDTDSFDRLVPGVNSLSEMEIRVLLRSVCRIPERVKLFSSLIRNIDELDYLEEAQGVPLYAACELGLNEDAAYLLNKGVDPNQCRGRSLAIAYMTNNSELVELLISKGANVKLAARENRPKSFSEHLKVQDLRKKDKPDH